MSGEVNFNQYRSKAKVEVVGKESGIISYRKVFKKGSIMRRLCKTNTAKEKGKFKNCKSCRK